MNDEILNLKTLDGVSIKSYFIMLLETLWKEGEGFSGKRPFGNSDWTYDLYAPLANAGLIDAEFDENDYPRNMDTDKGYDLILKAIKSL
jgi:hypothetical protein